MPVVSISCPQQTNGSDCGVYVVLFARSIAEFIIEENGVVGAKKERDTLLLSCSRLSQRLAAEVRPEDAVAFRQQSTANIVQEAAEYRRR